MKFDIGFVPPGGGETDYSAEVESDILPNEGDYISLLRKYRKGFETEDFIVKRKRWILEEISEGKYKANVSIEAEFAESPNSSENHKKACEIY